MSDSGFVRNRELADIPHDTPEHRCVGCGSVLEDTMPTQARYPFGTDDTLTGWCPGCEDYRYANTSAYYRTHS